MAKRRIYQIRARHEAAHAIIMRAIVLLFIVLFAACSQRPELIIPNAGKDNIFTQFANPITDKYGLPKLRETSLSGDDLEVRVWVVTFKMDGFILKRTNDNWSATAIKEIDCSKENYYPKDKTYELGKSNLSAPKSGWEKTWQKLVETRILDLPDPSQLEGEKFPIDGIGYAVETNLDGKYRFY